jgi:hypothetical protein
LWYIHGLEPSIQYDTDGQLSLHMPVAAEMYRRSWAPPLHSSLPQYPSRLPHAQSNHHAPISVVPKEESASLVPPSSITSLRYRFRQGVCACLISKQVELEAALYHQPSRHLFLQPPHAEKNASPQRVAYLLIMTTRNIVLPACEIHQQSLLSRRGNNSTGL